MKLYGSLTSPFVRSTRILLAENKVPYDFQKIDIWNPNDRLMLKEINPLLKIPVLVDHKNIIFDSRIIFNYLQKEKNLHPPLSWNDENIMTYCEEIMLSFLHFFQHKRSHIEVPQDSILHIGHSERLNYSLEWMDKNISQLKNYTATYFFCLMDWCDFRNVYDFQKYKNICDFVKEYSQKNEAKNTDPRN